MVCEGCQTVEYEPVPANVGREKIHRGKASDFRWVCELHVKGVRITEYGPVLAEDS